MNGGSGNDTYFVDSTGDTLTDSSGIDTVRSTVTYTLPTGFEHLTLLGSSAINGTGNTVANTLIGNAGNNTLSGLGGNDTLNGAAGNDLLIGGAGRDAMLGGNNADTFDFNSVAETLPATRDVIMDFSRGQGDKIDLSNIDARVDLAGDQAFTFIGTAAFTGIDGQLRQGGSVIQGDVNGDTVADFEIVWNFAGSPLIASDFIL
jgi:Ca2+-binding RTX toxin-like protein